MTAINEELVQIENTIVDLEESLKKIKDEMRRSDFAAEIFLIKLKHEKVRVMNVVAKSQEIMARMDQMLANTEFGVALNNLGSQMSQQTRTSKKKADAHSEESSHKKIKLTTEREPEKQRDKSRSSRSNKENGKKTSSKKYASKTQEKMPEPQVSMNTNVPSTSPKSVPCSVPLRNLTNNNIWPVHEKKTIFLSYPPVRDTKVNKNIGYYSSAHANEMIGYNPDSVPQAQSSSMNCNSFTAKSLSSSSNNQQVCCPVQLNRAYNLSVTPGYNLCVSPGYVIRHQTQAHHPKNSTPHTEDVVSVTSDHATPKIKSSNQKNTPKVTNDCNNGNNDITNKLFRDLMCNKNNEAKYDDISMASAETLVITKDFKIDSDFDTFQQF